CRPPPAASRSIPAATSLRSRSRPRPWPSYGSSAARTTPGWRSAWSTCEGPAGWMNRDRSGLSWGAPDPTMTTLLALSLLLPLQTTPGGAPAAPEPPSRALLRELASAPRLAGTIGSIRGADVVKRHLEAAGFQVEIQEQVVLLSLPRSIELSI